MTATFQPGRLTGVGVFRPDVHRDIRGVFVETFDSHLFASLGLTTVWVQDSLSQSNSTHTVRGLHFQRPPRAQAKLVRVSAGTALDAVVDLRAGSPTFGRYEVFELSSDRWELLHVPRGFAHGFCTLAPNTEISYKMSDHFSPDHYDGIRWDDPTLAIPWPVPATEAIVSERDAALPLFDGFDSPFLFEENS